MKTNIRHRQTNRHAAIQRQMGSYGSDAGPTVVVIAGIHGNEPSGVFAYLDLLDELQQSNVRLSGRVVGLAGNLSALQQGVRFIDRDLNRVWVAAKNTAPSAPGLDGGGTPALEPPWRCDPLEIGRAHV